MHLAVEFPLAPYHWGDNAVFDLARAIEEIGYEEIDLFEHVTVGHATPTRPVTRRIRRGIEVLVLPQRQPALVAKQVATLDVLSGGWVRYASASESVGRRRSMSRSAFPS